MTAARTIGPRVPTLDGAGTLPAERWPVGPQERLALRMLRDSTAGTFRVWSLAGPRCAATRAAIASALNGARVPQSAAGVSALASAFYRLALVNGGRAGDCLAARERSFAEWAAAECVK